jgi:hypothetical protein
VLHQPLLKKLDSFLDLNLARLKCLSLLISAVLRHRTVNLSILSTENLSGAKNESCYRRFQNFFLKCALPQSSVGRLILSKIPKPAKGWVLSMDRTNWKYGKRHINILTIGIVVNKVAIPIVWTVLPQTTKRGNSNSQQRIKLFARLLKLMEAKDIFALTMDREFGGEKWLKWLDQKKVGYVVRIKKNILVNGKSAHEHPVTRKGKNKTVRSIMGLKVFFANKVIQSKGRRDSHLYVISNRFHGREALALYRMRWGIEQLFSHLKKRGFDLEITHMTNAAKLEKLFAVVSLAFLFSFAWGCQLRKIRKSTAPMKRKSIFRIGLEGILRLLNNPHLKEAERREFSDWLTSPIFSSIFIV